MAVTLVEEVPRGLPVRRAGRTVAMLIGLPLILCGSLCAVVPSFLTIAFAIAFWFAAFGDDSSTSSTPAPTGWELLSLALVYIVPFLAIWGGIRMIRGRRRLGLYLRKFGFTAGTETVSHALVSVVGRSLRLVTLDGGKDESGADEVRHIGAGRRRRVLAATLAALAPVILSAVMIDLAVNLRTRLEKGDIQKLTGGPSIVDILLMIVEPLVLVAAPALILVSVMGGRTYLATRRVERGARTELKDPQEVDVVASKLGNTARHIIAPRLAVVRVPGSFWERAVYGLAAVSDVAVIDVSHPTVPLLWEVGNIRPLFDGRYVLVGARDKVAQLATLETAAADTPAGQLARLLEHDTILVYGPDKADQKRFTRSLRRAIEAVQQRAARAEPTGTLPAPAIL